MDDRYPRPPSLRREVVIPPSSEDIHEMGKRLEKNNGQIVRWKRLPGRGVVMGVCSGLAYRFGWKPWKVRLAFVAATLVSAGIPVAFYLLAAAFVPARKCLPRDFNQKTGTLNP